MVDRPADENETPITSLSRAQRRVIGVLLEKGFTTPEVYPLTLKATISGCNQKSNRDPVVNYDEAKVEEALEQLNTLGLTATVYNDSGRTPRYRHYMRKRFTLTEQQLAILTELLLRGRQSVGDLRARASRMALIETLEELRAALQGLIDLKLVQSDGPLDRRGAEVDHNWYVPGENRPPAAAVSSSAREEPVSVRAPEPRPSTPVAAAPPAPKPAPTPSPASETLFAQVAKLTADNHQLREKVHQLSDEVARLTRDFDELRRALGG